MTYKANKILSSVIKSFDIFGISYSFLMKNQSKFKTFLGGWITIFFYIVSLALFFSFGVDFYQRKNPKISLNSKNLQHQEVNFSNKNFTLAFRIEDESGLQVFNKSIVYSEVGFFTYKIQDNRQWLMTYKNDNQSLTYTKCSEMDDYRQKEQNFNISLSSWYCINFDNSTLGGNWDGNFVSGLIINTRICSDKRYKDLKCLDQESIRKEFKKGVNTGANLFYSFLYLESLPVMDNYNNPIKSYLINKYEMLDLNILKRSVQTFKRITIDSDVGWLFPDREESTYYSNDIIMQDFSLKDEIKEDLLYTHLIYLGRKEDIFSRSYSKLQEVLANVGGFAKILLIVLNFFYYYIENVSKNLFLLERFEFCEEKEINEEKFQDKNFIKTVNLFENKLYQRNISNENQNLNKKKINNFFETKIHNTPKKFYENSSHIEKSLNINNEGNRINEIIKFDNKNHNFEHFQNAVTQSYKNDVNNQNNILGNIKYNPDDEDLKNDKNQKFPNTTKNIPNFISSQKNIVFKMNSLDNPYKNNNHLNRFEKENFYKEENNNNENFMRNFGRKLSENELKNILPIKSKADPENIYDRNNINNLIYKNENNTDNNKTDRNHSNLNAFSKHQNKNEEIVILAKDSRNKIIKKKLSFLKYFIYELKSLCKKKINKSLKNNNSKIHKINSQNEQRPNKNLPPINNNLKSNSADNCFDVNNSNYNLKENKINEIKKNKLSNNLINICERNSISDLKKKVLKNEIYKNYKFYEYNLNNFFNVFNYLDLVKDNKFFKEILFGKNKHLFDLLKYNLEPIEMDLNERISQSNENNNEEYTNTFILENLNKVIYQKY